MVMFFYFRRKYTLYSIHPFRIHVFGPQPRSPIQGTFFGRYLMGCRQKIAVNTKFYPRWRTTALDDIFEHCQS